MYKFLNIMSRIFLYFWLMQLTSICYANDDNFIREYFTYKNIHRVVGFSCGTTESDFKLLRTFSDMYTFSSMWNLKSAKSSHLNLERLLRTTYKRVGIFLDLRCNMSNYSLILSEASKYFMYDDMHKWLILDLDLSHGLKLLDDSTFSVVTDVVLAIPSTHGYVLYDIYNPSKSDGASINATTFGTWHEKTGFYITLTQSKLARRSNLHGIRLKVGVLIGYKTQNVSVNDVLLDNRVRTKHGRTKFLYNVLLHMSDLFNFTMDIVEINGHKKYDYRGPIFTAFLQKRIDLSATPVAMNAERLNYGDIVAPVWPIRSCFMFRTISSTKMKTAQFLRPLSPKVWYFIAMLIGVAVSVLIVLLRLEGIHSVTESCGISVLLTIGALSQQGSAFVPIHYAGRIAFLQIMLFSVLILNYYSASVVSDRLKNIGEKMNDSLISLTKSNLIIAAEPTQYINSLVQGSDPEVRYFHRNRWLKLTDAERYMPLKEGLRRVSKGGFAYHTMTDTAYPYIDRTFEDRMICELTEVHLYRATLALWTRRRSPFTKLLRVGVTKALNVGIKRRLLKRWMARKPFCPNNMLVAEPLSIHEAAPILIFLTSCMALSLIICVMENFVFWLWPTRWRSPISEKRKLLRRDTSTWWLNEFLTIRS